MHHARDQHVGLEHAIRELEIVFDPRRDIGPLLVPEHKRLGAVASFELGVDDREFAGQEAWVQHDDSLCVVLGCLRLSIFTPRAFGVKKKVCATTHFFYVFLSLVRPVEPRDRGRGFVVVVKRQEHYGYYGLRCSVHQPGLLVARSRLVSFLLAVRARRARGALVNRVTGLLAEKAVHGELAGGCYEQTGGVFWFQFFLFDAKCVCLTPNASV